MDKSKRKVAIVDDHLLFASSLEKLISTFKNYQVLFKVGNGLQLQEKLESIAELPDTILLDVKMPIMGGYETLKWLKENHSQIRVLVLSMEDEENLVIKMIRNGANGYLLKDIEPQCLLQALDEMDKSGFFFTDKVNEIINKSDNNDLVELKEQEIVFLKLACTEMTYKEIAEEMHLSPKTIDGYRHDLFNKLNVKNRVGLVLYAIKHNYLD